MITLDTPTWLARLAGHARALQCDLLRSFEQLDESLARLDAATAAHLAHGAMAGADPLHDSLHGQLECSAAEGGQAPLPYRSAQLERITQAGRDPGLAWLMLAAALVAVLVSMVWPLGVAG